MRIDFLKSEIKKMDNLSLKNGENWSFMIKINTDHIKSGFNIF